jgi:transcriptional regulator with XRE-family HTH domain
MMMTPFIPSLGKSYTQDLRERLEDFGISQLELAREVGVDQTQISRWFNKKMEPRFQTIQKLEAALERILDERRKKRRAAR